MNGVATFFRESMAGRFFILFGVACIVMSVLFFMADNQSKNYIKTKAVVSKTELVEEESTDANGDHVDATYKVFVKYTVDGKEYEEELGELSGFKKGDKMDIVYDPKDPTKISQPSSIIISIALLVAGIVSIVGGVISLVNAMKKHKAMKAQEEGWKNGK